MDSITTSNTESFAQLLEESFTHQEMRAGNVITAEIISIGNGKVVVNAGLKSESMIDINEFQDMRGDVALRVGDFVRVMIEKLEDGFGSTILSREKAKRIETWLELEEAMNEGRVVTGLVSGKIKGGLRVSVNGVPAFLPGSLIDVRPVKDTTPYENKECELKVIKIDRKRNNIVVSRRAAMESSVNADRQELISHLVEGAVLKGIIKNITDYGAFVDLGGIDGLLHITDIAWRRIRHPSEILAIGDEVQAKVLKFDQEKKRVSLGMKQLGSDPWNSLAQRYPVGTKTSGRVSNLADYGAFVEIEEGIEGLIHVSEMDWTNKNIHPGKVAQLGDNVDVVILEIDEARRRLSLGMKQCLPNPWQEFATLHKRGDKISGIIKSITDFGIFVEMAGGIDGLVHSSDLSSTQDSESALRLFKKGEALEAMVLSVDVEKERISLGIRQMTEGLGDVAGDVAATTTTSKPKRGKTKTDDAVTASDEKDEDSAPTTHLGALLKAKLDNQKTE